jgi:hypothetical protein
MQRAENRDAAENVDGEHAERHRRPSGVDDTSVEATGRLSEGLEYIHRVRGALYEAHQLMGRADFLFEESADLLQKAGHTELATFLDTEVVGRNVLSGRWTFQVMEEFDDTYYDVVVAAEARVREQLLAGRRHVFESELKEERRTRGRPGHESRPREI